MKKRGYLNIVIFKYKCEIEEQYSYDVYGQPSNTSSVGNPYLFTGRRYDDEISLKKLYYYRARIYSADLGRFLQPDPIGYPDSLNIYAYCLNNPINWIDPYGLTPFGVIPIPYPFHPPIFIPIPIPLPPPTGGCPGYPGVPSKPPVGKPDPFPGLPYPWITDPISRIPPFPFGEGVGVIQLGPEIGKMIIGGREQNNQASRAIDPYLLPELDGRALYPRLPGKRIGDDPTMPGKGCKE